MRVLGVRGLCGLTGPANSAEEKLGLSSVGLEKIMGHRMSDFDVPSSGVSL